MIPYFIVFFICFIFTLFDLFVCNKSLKKIMIILFGIIIIFFAGIRWETGTDWENYLLAFNSIHNVDIGTSGYEYFYELLLLFSSTISERYSLVLFLIAIIIFSFTSFTLKKYSPYPLFSLLLLLSYSINSSGFGYRQDIAISICFFSIYFVLKRNLLFFLIFVFFASLFHQSAIIFIPAYWVIHFILRKINILYLLFIIIFLYLLISEISFLASLYSESAVSKLSIYNDMSPEEKLMGNENKFVVLFRGVLNRSFILIIPLFVIINNKNDTDLYLKIFNIVFFGLILFILFSPLGYVFLRFTRYFEIFHILLIPLTLNSFKSNQRLFLILFYLIYCTVKFTFVLYIDDDVYVPYQTVF